MLQLKDIEAVSGHPQIRQFAGFIISQRGDLKFPIMKKLDLMQIPGLVKCLWKINYCEDNGGTLNIVFTGSEVDRFWKVNPSKVGTVDKLYAGKDYEDVMPQLYKKSLQEGKVAYTRRNATIIDEDGPRRAAIEAIFFPTSSDGETVDSGIGYVDYFSKSRIDENIYLLL